MKKILAFIGVLTAIAVTVIYIRTRTDFPSLSGFEEKVTCKDEYSSIKSQKVKVDIYLLHKNEHAPYNEVIMVITMIDSGKQFAARNIIEGADANEIEKTKESRKIYVGSRWRWQEVNDGKKFIAEVVKNAPKEYLLDYSFTSPSEPVDEWDAYKNLLWNCGCSLHGPIG